MKAGESPKDRIEKKIFPEEFKVKFESWLLEFEFSSNREG